MSLEKLVKISGGTITVPTKFSRLIKEKDFKTVDIQERVNEVKLIFGEGDLNIKEVERSDGRYFIRYQNPQSIFGQTNKVTVTYDGENTVTFNNKEKKFYDSTSFDEKVKITAVSDLSQKIVFKLPSNHRFLKSCDFIDVNHNDDKLELSYRSNNGLRPIKPKNFKIKDFRGNLIIAITTNRTSVEDGIYKLNHNDGKSVINVDEKIEAIEITKEDLNIKEEPKREVKLNNLETKKDFSIMTNNDITDLVIDTNCVLISDKDFLISEGLTNYKIDFIKDKKILRVSLTTSKMNSKEFPGSGRLRIGSKILKDLLPGSDLNKICYKKFSYSTKPCIDIFLNQKDIKRYNESEFKPYMLVKKPIEATIEARSILLKNKKIVKAFKGIEFFEIGLNEEHKSIKITPASESPFSCPISNEGNEIRILTSLPIQPCFIFKFKKLNDGSILLSY